MVDRVQFEETQYSSTPVRQIHPSRMVNLLIENGIVQNAVQANIILVGLIIIFVLGTIFFIRSATVEDEVYIVEPPIEEQTNPQ